MAHVEPEGGTLPLYVIDPDAGPEETGSPDVEAPKHQHLTDAVQESWGAGRCAAPALGAAGGSGGTHRRNRVRDVAGLVIAITRHLVMAPSDTVRACSTAAPPPLRTDRDAAGTLTLSTDSAGRGRTDRAQLRAVAGRLHLWLSPLPLPVELDLVPWGRWRTMITLHPDRRFRWSVGPHRRRATSPPGMRRWTS